MIALLAAGFLKPLLASTRQPPFVPAPLPFPSLFPRADPGFGSIIQISAHLS